MKAKKLTKREWYLAAQRWDRDEDWMDKLPIAISESWAAAVASVGKHQEEISAEYENRVCFYVQYCLERAGIPAGDK